MTNKRVDTIAGIIALVIIGVSWYLGTQRAVEDILPHIESACKEASIIEQRESNVFEAHFDEREDSLYAYLIINDFL